MLLASAALLLLSAGSSAEQGVSEAVAPTPSLTLVTVGPGDIYWERFGHNGVIVDDHSGNPRMISYGYFDFEQADFMQRFLRGQMLYSTASLDPASELAFYRSQGRAVWLQPLTLPAENARRLADLLLTSALPENADYLYNYFENNCSTRVRDAIDAVLEGALRRQLSARSRGYSYRAHALRLSSPDLPMYLGIHAALGKHADRALSAWQEGFIPMELMRYLADVRIDFGDGQLRSIAAEPTLLSAPRVADTPDQQPNWFWWFLLVGLLLAGLILLLAFSRRRCAAARWTFALMVSGLWLALGSAGMVLALLRLATDHSIAGWNENLFQFSPLCLLAIPMLLRSAGRGSTPGRFGTLIIKLTVSIAAFGAFLGVLPAFSQDNLDWIALILPSHLALWLALALGWLGREPTIRPMRG